MIWKVIVMKEKYFLIVIGLLLFTGCFNNNVSKAYKRQAKINAVNYVKEKYGFNSSVISASLDTKCDPLFCSSSNPTGSATVKLRANGRKFVVHISGTSANSNGVDNYQQRDIENAFISLFENNYGLSVYKSFFMYNASYFDSNQINLIQEYYDDNLNVVLNDASGIELYLINYNNLSSIDISNIKNYLPKCKIALINFDSVDAYNRFLEEKSNISKTCTYMCDEHLNDFKSDALVIIDGEAQYYNYK